MGCPECKRLIEEENQAMIEFSIADAERRAFRPGRPPTDKDIERRLAIDEQFEEAARCLDNARRSVQAHQLTHEG
jgi:hypothetical protein